jgi:DNA-directed RNA polymerase
MINEQNQPTKQQICSNKFQATVIKPQRMTLVRHVTHMGELRNVYKILSENLKGTDDLEDVSVVRRIMKWILTK